MEQAYLNSVPLSCLKAGGKEQPQKKNPSADSSLV